MAKVGVIGPSHLAIVWSAVLAEKGNHVNYVKTARFECYEPGLKELIQKGTDAGTLNYTNLYSSLDDCDIVFLAADTPTDSSNNIQLDIIEKYIAAIIPHINDSAIFVIMSQVPPGFCRKIKFDHDRLFHQVDTLIFGNSIRGALNPKHIIIGCYEDSCFKDVDSYATILDSFENTEVSVVKFEEAEVYKLAMNASLAAQIVVTNTMAQICGQFNAKWSKVADCLGRDSRIGAYTKPGLGIGGGHLMRDLHTIEALSRKNGINCNTITAAISDSKYMQYWAFRELKRYRPDPCWIALWGLSYKENTDSAVDSPAILTVKSLPDYNFWAHDPRVNLNYENLSVTGENPLDTIDNQTDALLVMTPHPEYKKIKFMEIAERLKANALVLDPYHMLDRYKFESAAYIYRTIG